METIRIAIAEDNRKLAEITREKLELMSTGIDVCFCACDGQEMVDYLQQNPDGVDAILMDIEMPRMDGIEATARIHADYPQIKVIMLTVFDDEDKIFRSIQSGAAGYLLKDEPAAKVWQGIQMIFDGGAPMSPAIAAKALELLRHPRKAEQTGSSDFQLTRREIEVLEQLREGYDYQKIAERLFIAPATVRKHIENIYRKLQVHNKIEALEKARKHHLL